MGKSKHYFAVVGLVALSTVALYVLLRVLYPLPIAASAEAQPIDTMFTWHFVLIAFLFSLIMVFVLYAAVVFRRKPGDDSDGPHIHGHTGLEIAWTFIPIVLVIGFGIYGVDTLRNLLKENPQEVTIEVYGQQWSWDFYYPEHENISSPNLLVLEVNQPVVLEMESRDVLHSFWVPPFRVKQDLLPGSKTYLRFTPTITTDGEPFKVQCAEICGQEHSGMLADVLVLNEVDYNAWVEEKLNAPSYGELTAAERGEIWYTEFGCNGCHSLDGSPLVGPSWNGVYGREEALESGLTVIADDEYLRRSILEPGAEIVAGYPNAMPANYEERFSEKEAQIMANEGLELDIIDDLIAFMQTLSE